MFRANRYGLGRRYRPASLRVRPGPCADPMGAAGPLQQQATPDVDLNFRLPPWEDPVQTLRSTKIGNVQKLRSTVWNIEHHSTEFFDVLLLICNTNLVGSPPHVTRSDAISFGQG